MEAVTRQALPMNLKVFLLCLFDVGLVFKSIVYENVVEAGNKIIANVGLISIYSLIVVVILNGKSKKQSDPCGHVLPREYIILLQVVKEEKAHSERTFDQAVHLRSQHIYVCLGGEDY